MCKPTAKETEFLLKSLDGNVPIVSTQPFVEQDYAYDTRNQAIDFEHSYSSKEWLAISYIRLKFYFADILICFYFSSDLGAYVFSGMTNGLINIHQMSALTMINYTS